MTKRIGTRQEQVNWFNGCSHNTSIDRSSSFPVVPDERNALVTWKYMLSQKIIDRCSSLDSRSTRGCVLTA